MTALSGGTPTAGVRYVFTLGVHDAMSATYDVQVRTASWEARATVRIDRQGAALVGDAADVDAAHVTQMLALARTLSKRDELPWPRRVERWRSPGVR